MTAVRLKSTIENRKRQPDEIKKKRKGVGADNNSGTKSRLLFQKRFRQKTLPVQLWYLDKRQRTAIDSYANARTWYNGIVLFVFHSFQSVLSVIIFAVVFQAMDTEGPFIYIPWCIDSDWLWHYDLSLSVSQSAICYPDIVWPFLFLRLQRRWGYGQQK